MKHSFISCLDDRTKNPKANEDHGENDPGNDASTPWQACMGDVRDVPPRTRKRGINGWTMQCTQILARSCAVITVLEILRVL